MIFQDPMTSLNPYLRISDQLIEPLLIHEKISRQDALQRGLDMLAAVGINDAATRINTYPHEFSGGMRQRVMIAMALITRPELLIADEPTTALDVTVQAQILELIRKMQKELNMAVICLTHDLAVVSGLCDRVQVMYAGRIVESAGTRDAVLPPAPSVHPRPATLDSRDPAQGVRTVHNFRPAARYLQAAARLSLRPPLRICAREMPDRHDSCETGGNFARARAGLPACPRRGTLIRHGRADPILELSAT